MKLLKSYKELFETKKLSQNSIKAMNIIRLNENKNNLVEELKEIINGNKSFYKSVYDLNFGDSLNNLPNFNIDEDTEEISWKLKSESQIDDILHLENGILGYIDSIDDYGFEMYVDDTEKEYIGRHVNEKTIKMITLFQKELGYKYTDDDEPNNLYHIFDFLDEIGLDTILEDYIMELSMINERGMKKLKTNIFDKNNVFYYNRYKNEFTIYLSELYDAIKNEKNINTIEEALINICSEYPYSYELEYNELYDYLDFKDISKTIETNVFNYYNEYIKDDYWLELIKNNDIDNFKKYYKKNDWSDTINTYFNYRLIFDVKYLKPSEYDFSDKIYEFIWSKEFFENIKDDFKNDLKTYEQYYKKMININRNKRAKQFNL